MKARTRHSITPGDERQKRLGNADERAALAAEIVAAAVLRGSFTLRSGAVSDYYIDKYRFTTQPALLARITDALLPHVPQDTQRIAGTVLGAVPLAVALSLRTGLPSVLVRADAKAYGTAKSVEGELQSGERVLLIEDVVTSGGAAIAAVEALRTAGATVSGILAVIDREDGGRERAAAAEVPFLALFTRTELGLGGQ
ncbi:orotate phosphoribosyltransferase [soil metagenome]